MTALTSSPMPPDLTTEVLRDTSAVEAIAATWRALAAQSPPLSPWQHWDFIGPWLRHATAPSHPAPVRPRVILVRRGAHPCLLLPLQLSTAGIGGMRWLEPIGMPDNIHRPRLGIGAPDRDAYGAGMRAIAGLWGEADGLRVDEMTADDAELHWLRELGTELGWRFRSAALHACPYLALPGDWPAYLRSRSAKLRKNLTAGRRRLAEVGPLQLVRYDTPDQLQEGLNHLYAVTARSWKAAAEIGLGASPAYREFFREFTMKMAQRGGARAYALFAGPRAIAVTLAFIEGDTYYSTQIAHDAEFDACSPGTLLESMEMEALIHEGRFKLFDFLGAALSNKRRWTDTMLATDRVMWLSGTLRARLFDLAYFGIKPRLTAMRRLFRS